VVACSKHVTFCKLSSSCAYKGLFNFVALIVKVVSNPCGRFLVASRMTESGYYYLSTISSISFYFRLSLCVDLFTF
jgi:hypothetical protein